MIFVAALKQFGLEAEQGAVGQEPERRRYAFLHSWPALGAFDRLAFPYRYSRLQLVVALAVVLATRMFHEYVLHVGQWFEGFTATEALEAICQFLTPALLMAIRV